MSKLKSKGSTLTKLYMSVDIYLSTHIDRKIIPSKVTRSYDYLRTLVTVDAFLFDGYHFSCVSKLQVNYEFK